MSYILYFLSIVGATQILMYGTIIGRIRPNWELFSCSLCLGFHVSLISYLLFYFFDENFAIGINFFLGLFTYSFAGSYVSYFFDRIINDNGINIKINEEKQED